MKRVLKFVGIILGVVLVFLIGVVVSALSGRMPIADGADVNGVRIVKDGPSSLDVVPLTSGHVAFIDGGNDKQGKAILAELSRRQLTIDSVDAIFLTHGHPDATSSVALFPHAQIMALQQEVPVVEGRKNSGGLVNGHLPVKPTGLHVTRPLQDGETVTLEETSFRVFAVPGPTVGSAAYLVNGVLFLGNAADHGSDGKIIASAWAFSESTAQDRQSLENLAQRLVREGADVKAIVFAHSAPLREGLAPLIAYAQKK